MTEQNTNISVATQIGQANEILIQLAGSVTAQDRKDAIKDLDVSELTIRRCLRGEAANLDTALRLIQFIRERVKARTELLQQN